VSISATHGMAHETAIVTSIYATKHTAECSTDYTAVNTSFDATDNESIIATFKST
jgi:hypothetical protein